MATSAAQPPPTPNNGEQDPTPSRLNQEVQEQPNKGPKIMKMVAFKKLTDEEQLIYNIFVLVQNFVKRLF